MRRVREAAGICGGNGEGLGEGAVVGDPHPASPQDPLPVPIGTQLDAEPLTCTHPK